MGLQVPSGFLDSEISEKGLVRQPSNELGLDGCVEATTILTQGGTLNLKSGTSAKQISLNLEP
jgi:hypothetical protein